jgi:hypothetical protein
MVNYQEIMRLCLIQGQRVATCSQGNNIPNLFQDTPGLTGLPGIVLYEQHTDGLAS